MKYVLFNISDISLGSSGFISTYIFIFSKVLLSDDVIKIKFIKLWDLSGYSEKTTSQRLTCQKLAFCGKN